MKNEHTTRLGVGRAIALGAAVLGSALALAATGAAPASADVGHSHGTSYVALGDSYASGPVIPDQVDASCARSDHNYPSLLAARERASLTDVTCSGATTVDMAAAQTTALGTVPAQFGALTKNTDLVTLTIGGNDIGFTTVVGTCARLTATDPTGAPCQAAFTSNGVDQLALTIQQTGSKVAAVLRGIHQRAPHAKVLLVGYPDLFPDNGVGCTSATVPFAAGDFPFLRDSNKELNSMLAKQARLGGAQYVDTYTPTVGHDMCQPTGTRWIESLAPATPAAPAHPNAQGEQAMAAAVERAVGACGPFRK